MFTFLLQDWLTLQGPSLNPAAPITQGELAWLDMSGFIDLVMWLQVSEISAGNYYCAFQTSPTKDESLFTAMNDVSAATGTPMAVGVQVGLYLRDTALCPLSHWLRWQIIPPASTAWNMTFRIWVSASQPGGIARDSVEAAEASSGGPAWVPGIAAGQPGSPWSPLSSAGAKSNIHTGPPVKRSLPGYDFSPGLVDTTRRHPVSKTDIRPHAFGPAGHADQGRHVYTTVHPVVPGATFNPNIGPRAPVEKK